MSTSTLLSLKNAKPAQVKIEFDKKELKYIISNSGEFISTLELSASFTRPVLMAILKVQKQVLDKLKIGDINKYQLSTVKITVTPIERKSQYTFSRRFMITEVTDSSMNGSQGKDYLLKCMDLYGYAICNDKFQYKGEVYNGKPVDNVINYMNNLFKKVKENYKDDNVIKVQHDEKYEYKDLPAEYSNENKENLFQIVNGSPLISLREYCLKYNIRVWQDYEGFHIVQNPMLSKFNKFNYYLSDKEQSDSPYYICDYKLDKSNREDNITKKLIKCSVTEGKNTIYKQVNIDMLLDSVMLNGDIEKYKKFLPKETSVEYGNTNTTFHSLTYNEFYKALKYKTLHVYLQGDMGYLYPGVLTDLHMMYNEEDREKQIQGDINLSKTWLITGSTYKVILGNDGKCFCRLVLNRFDDPEDIISKEDSSIYTLAKNKYESEISLSGLVDDIKGALKGTLDRLRNSFNSLKNSLFSIKDFLNNWFSDTTIDLRKSIDEIKSTLKSFSANLKEAQNEAKNVRLIYNNSNYSIDSSLLNDIETEFKGIDLDSLFANFYESLEEMELDDASKKEFTLAFEDAKRDLNKFKDTVNDLFKDYYNKNNRNITYKSLDTTTSSQYHTNSEKTKEELNIQREKQLSKIREKQDIIRE